VVKKKSIAIIGGGPAALGLASHLNSTVFDITIYEKGNTLGRKFLVAGKGGFNLTHSESIEKMITRYYPPLFLDKALNKFTNLDLQDWLEGLGIPTFIGSSRRVYPMKGIKPIDVLNAIRDKVVRNSVEIKYNHEWLGCSDNNSLLFRNQDGIHSDYIVYALGGGSWKVTGSDGEWLNGFSRRGIKVVGFQPSNCAFEVGWGKEFVHDHAGAPLKNIALRCNGVYEKGELVITRFGLEGNAIYALSRQIRELLQVNGTAEVMLDFKPTLTEDEVLRRIETSPFKKRSDVLRKTLKLSSTQIALLRDGLTKDDYLADFKLAKGVKSLGIQLVGLASLDEAISSVGGVSVSAVNSNYELHDFPNEFCIGEMLDWDAPTGGYLLQACFSMGIHLAGHINELEK